MSPTAINFAPCTIGGGEIDVFASQPKTCPFVIEFFSGSGRVTAQLKHVGVKAPFGVDHKQLSKIAPIQVCDLSTLAGHKLCMQWCKSLLLAGVFAAPPCGTCSKAREIILPDSKGRPLPGPVPVRGIPIVTESPRNSLYWLTSFFQIIKHHFKFTAHQACAYGSKRPKWIALAHTQSRFARINMFPWC